MDDRVKELYDMCRNNDFSITRANELLDEIDVNEPIHDDPNLEQHITTSSRIHLYVLLKNTPQRKIFYFLPDL